MSISQIENTLFDGFMDCHCTTPSQDKFFKKKLDLCSNY